MIGTRNFLRWIGPTVAILLGGHAAMALASSEVTPAITEKDAKVGRLLDDLSQRAATSPDPLVWRDLGIVQCRLGLYKDAAGSLEQAVASGALEDDFYLHAFAGLTAEMRGELVRAAEHYERAAALARRTAEGFEGRARLVRVREAVSPVDADGDFGRGEATLAILAPVDLGGGSPELVSAIGAVLHLGLDQVEGVDALTPADTERWLAADGRAATDLDDEAVRDRVARGLARKGVEMVVASSFLPMESGEIRYRLALVPVGAGEVGETRSIPVRAGEAGRELEPLVEAVTGICQQLGVAATGISIPAGLEAARAYQDGLAALEQGALPAARESMCRAAAMSPDVTALAHWCEELEALAAGDDVPLARDLSQPRVTVVDAVREVALSERNRRRRFDDL